MAWLRVGQASRVFQRLGDVTAVAAPVLRRHLPSTSDLGIKLNIPTQSHRVQLTYFQLLISTLSNLAFFE